MNCHYVRYSFEYFLNQMKENGFEAFEIWGGCQYLFPLYCNADRITDLKRTIRQSGLKLICYTPEQITYPLNIAAPERDIRLISLEYYRKALQVADDLEAGLMLLTPGWGYLDGSRDEAMKYSLDSIALITGWAEKLGIILALEHLSPISSNLINSSRDLRYVLDCIASPNLKAMLDTCQVGLANETIQDYLDVLGKDLAHVHFVDGVPGGHLVPGEGSLPLQKWLRDLDDYGYDAYLSLEIADRRYYLDPVAADRKSRAIITEWLN
jgi:protein FrlC